jgi:Calcineurin-like phosphoesterase
VLGLLYDVHGNLPALEAVLEDCPAERFLLGGDHVGFGAWPRETAARLDGLDAEWIRGNVDRWMVDAPDAPEAMLGVIERSRELAGEELCRRMAALPETTTHDGTLYCHASPLSDMDGFYAEPHEGSVGIPLDGDRRAAYALLRDDGSIELRRAEYDWQASADAVREKIGELPAKRIEQARFDVS